MKPIEPGCLALITGFGTPGNEWVVGQVVRVIERALDGERHNGKINYFGGRWCWAAKGLKGESAFSYHLPEHLLRIDGGEDESLTERHDEEVGA